MKIIHINTFGSSGGAGIAAGRLVQALNLLAPGSASILSGYPQEALPAFAGRLLKFKTLARSAADIMLAGIQGLKKENRFLFSSARFGQDLASDPLVTAADIIHIHWINQGFLSVHDLESLAGLGKPMVFTMHDMWLLSGGCHYSGECRNYEGQCGHCFMLKNPSPTDLSARNLMRKKQMLKRVKPAIITCSHWLEKEAASSSLLHAYAVRTIPNPIDTAFFTPGDRRAAKAALGFTPEERIITLSAYKLTDPRKGFSYFLEAMALLKQSAFSARIRLVLIGNLGSDVLPEIPFPVTYTGYLKSQAEIITYGQATDLFILPSVEDNLPNTVMEMMSMGVPVVAFNTGGIPDLIDHKLNGYLAFYRSSASLAKGILWTLNDLEKGPRLKKEARLKVISSFEMKMVAGRYMEVYRELV